MRKLLLSAVLLLCVSQAAAWTPGRLQNVSIKRGASVATQTDVLIGNSSVPMDLIVIPGLPYSDSGNTCESVNMLDVACPYLGSASPEVVYTYTPMVDKHISIDLCFSSYDTKVYVLDMDENVIGCNDDAYWSGDCYLYSSFLDVELDGDQQYLIVIDGYGEDYNPLFSDCGDYVLNIELFESCIGESHPHGMDEGEPPLYENYVDVYNGGCYFPEPNFNVTPFAWTSLGEGDCGYLNGATGWYSYYDGTGEYYDTDWFEVVAASSTLELGLSGELPMYLYVITPSCDDPVWLLEAGTPDYCSDLQGTISVVPGETYWVFVEPADDERDLDLMYNYTLMICGHESQALPTTVVNWSEIKAIYR